MRITSWCQIHLKLKPWRWTLWNIFRPFICYLDDYNVGARVCCALIFALPIINQVYFGMVYQSLIKSARQLRQLRKRNLFLINSQSLVNRLIKRFLHSVQKIHWRITMYYVAQKQFGLAQQLRLQWNLVSKLIALIVENRLKYKVQYIPTAINIYTTGCTSARKSSYDISLTISANGIWIRTRLMVILKFFIIIVQRLYNLRTIVTKVNLS